MAPTATAIVPDTPTLHLLSYRRQVPGPRSLAEVPKTHLDYWFVPRRLAVSSVLVGS